MRKPDTLKTAQLKLIYNIAYGGYNLLIAFWYHSWWYVALSAYYVTLSVIRFAVVLSSRKIKDGVSSEFVMHFTGYMFLFMTVILAGTTYMTTEQQTGTKHHEIVMITIALYAFTKITNSIIKLVKSKKEKSLHIKTLRNISFADALVSIFSLQRSMLVTFDGLKEHEIVIFNALTGSAVYLMVFLLGHNLIGGKRIDMAKSKLVKAGNKVADATVKGYKAVEKGVVTGYKKVEDVFVSGYQKVEDKFVDKYLTKENETVEEAKQRLKNKNN